MKKIKITREHGFCIGVAFAIQGNTVSIVVPFTVITISF